MSVGAFQTKGTVETTLLEDHGRPHSPRSCNHSQPRRGRQRRSPLEPLVPGW